MSSRNERDHVEIRIGIRKRGRKVKGSRNRRKRCWATVLEVVNDTNSRKIVIQEALWLNRSHFLSWRARLVFSLKLSYLVQMAAL